MSERDDGDGSPARGGLVCNLAALDQLQQKRRALLEEWLRVGTVDITELADGFRFYLDPTSLAAQHVEEFITLERLCCPFLRIDVRSDPRDPGVVLEIGGGEEIKDFVAAQFEIRRDGGRAG